MIKRRWTREEDEILKENFGKTTRKLIVDKINRSYGAISYRAKVIGCSSYDYATRGLLMRGKNRKYLVNEKFFDTLNLLNCYWAGFIAADGCINSNRRDVVIGIQQKDLEHLVRFAKDCEYNGNIVSVKAHVSSPINGRAINSGPSVRLEFYGMDAWIKSLKENFNIIDRKSLILEPPNITGNLALAFIAGYLDGDGCIYCHEKRDSISVSFRGTFNLLNWIKLIFDKISPNKKQSKVYTMGTHPSYAIGGKRALKILAKIDNLNLPQIKRKWQKYKDYTERKKHGRKKLD